MPSLYRKTAKGSAEIETRAHRLPPRLRSALILVDGKRSDVQLHPLIPQQPEQTLQALLEQGFIEAVAPAPPPPSPREQPSPSPADFAQQRRDAVRLLSQALGPAADTLAIRMERARTAAELRPLLAAAVQAIGTMRGRAAAEDYAARFNAV